MTDGEQLGAVVLGLEINGLNVVRALGRRGVHVVGIDRDLAQFTAHSRYLRGRVATADLRGEALLDTLCELGRDGRRRLLFPTMDGTVHLLSALRARLPGHLLLELPDHDTVHALMHKGGFRELADRHGLLSPGCRVARDPAELERAAAELRFPLVMKSTMKRTGPTPKAAVVADLEGARRSYSEQGGGEMILEEWIPGTDADVYFCLQAWSARDPGRPLCSFVGRKLRQWPPLVGGTAAAEPAEAPEVEAATTAFFAAVGYRGLGSMEYKRDPRDGRYYAIEPTVGRTDFQSGVAVANGVNIPHALWAAVAGLPPPAPRRPARPVRWVEPTADARAALLAIERGELTHDAWRASLRGPRVTSVFAADDPGPWLRDIASRVRGRLARLLRRG
ncbi:MAG: hypothetical protein IPM29_25750 [Planctomycetes bacterium]|nr:hypothetical protein [Planctomycetota bacterium]